MLILKRKTVVMGITGEYLEKDCIWSREVKGFQIFEQSTNLLYRGSSPWWPWSERSPCCCEASERPPAEAKPRCRPSSRACHEDFTKPMAMVLMTTMRTAMMACLREAAKVWCGWYPTWDKCLESRSIGQLQAPAPKSPRPLVKVKATCSNLIWTKSRRCRKSSWEFFYYETWEMFSRGSFQVWESLSSSISSSWTWKGILSCSFFSLFLTQNCSLANNLIEAGDPKNLQVD